MAKSSEGCDQRSALTIPLVTAVLGALLPPFVANRLRMAALRAAGLNIGVGTLMWDVPSIICNGDVRQKLTIGAGCGFNVGCFFLLEAPVTIEDDVSCGHEVMFLSRDGGASELDGPPRDPINAGIVIGAGSWLGARSVILSGVTVGAGAVIGAGSVVSDDVPANTLISGRQSISLARWR
jgi:acetyltransferase-like isoleucine patch superfamily enzyme